MSSAPLLPARAPQMPDAADAPEVALPPSPIAAAELDVPADELAPDPNAAVAKVDEPATAALVTAENETVQQAVTAAEEAVTSVDQGVTWTEQSVTSLDQTVTWADESVTPIEQSVTAAEHGVTPIEQGVTSIEQTVTAVEQSVAPAVQSLPPIEQSLPPMEKSVALLDQTVTRVEHSVTPIQQTVTSVDQSVPLIEQSVTAAEQSVMLIDESVTPIEQSVTAAEHGVTAAGQGVTPPIEQSGLTAMTAGADEPAVASTASVAGDEASGPAAGSSLVQTNEPTGTQADRVSLAQDTDRALLSNPDTAPPAESNAGRLSDSRPPLPTEPAGQAVVRAETAAFPTTPDAANLAREVRASTTGAVDIQPLGTAEVWPALGPRQPDLQSTPRPTSLFVSDLLTRQQTALTRQQTATQLGDPGPVATTGMPSARLTSSLPDLAPALVAASAPLQPTRPPAPRQQPRSAHGPPPLGASSSLDLSDAGSPETAPTLLVGLSMLATWRALWLLARLRPPAICLSSLTPPG